MRLDVSQFVVRELLPEAAIQTGVHDGIVARMVRTAVDSVCILFFFISKGVPNTHTGPMIAGGCGRSQRD